MSKIAASGANAVAVTSRRIRLGASASESRLFEEWDELFESSPTASPYNHRAWTSTWIDHFAAGEQVEMVEVRDGSRLVGLLPLVSVRAPMGTFATLMPAGGDLADDGEPLLGPDPELAARAIAGYLCGRVRRSTRSFCLPRLADDGPMATALAATLPGHMRQVCVAETTRLSIRFELFEDAGPSLARIAKRRDVPRNRRRLSEAHRVDYIDNDCSEQSIGQLLELNAARWSEGAEQEQGLFATRASRAFACDAIVALGRAGVARLGSLTADGEPFAMGLGYVVGQRYIGHKLVVSRDLARYGPGQMMIHQLAQDALDGGLREYDLGRGDSPFKRQWANHERRVVSCAVVRSGPFGNLQLLAQRAQQSRRVRQTGRS